jgi:hypothetical protein
MMTKKSTARLLLKHVGTLESRLKKFAECVLRDYYLLLWKEAKELNLIKFNKKSGMYDPIWWEKK